MQRADDLLQHIAARIQTHRRRLGLSQEQLAERACVGVTTVSRLENGRVDMGISLLHRVAVALECSVGDLTDDGDRPGDGPLLASWHALDDETRRAVQHIVRQLSDAPRLDSAAAVIKSEG